MNDLNIWLLITSKMALKCQLLFNTLLIKLTEMPLLIIFLASKVEP